MNAKETIYARKKYISELPPEKKDLTGEQKEILLELKRLLLEVLAIILKFNNCNTIKPRTFYQSIMMHCLCDFEIMVNTTLKFINECTKQ